MISRSQFYVNDTVGHRFKRGEIVRIVQVVSAELVICANDKGEVWTVQRKQLLPYKKYGT